MSDLLIQDQDGMKELTMSEMKDYLLRSDTYWISFDFMISLSLSIDNNSSPRWSIEWQFGHTGIKSFIGFSGFDSFNLDTG